ncbi:MAG: penicillin-binding transpeptidase domain-containing protein [Thiolinea sp.]
MPGQLIFSTLRSGQVDMIQALRSPGSALKPFLYRLALDEGLIHSASLLVDAPLKLADYAPQNFLREHRGPVSAATALQLSLNVPAVDLLQRINPVTFDAPAPCRFAPAVSGAGSVPI